MRGKKKLTRLCSFLLVLVMVVGMMPTIALAAESATANFVDHPDTAPGLLGSNASWDASNKILTLSGVNFETTVPIAVQLPADATIVLEEDTINTITGGDSTSDHCFGIYAVGDLTIEGTGTLNVTGGNADATGASKNSYGIFANGGVTVQDTAVVTAEGGTSQKGVSYGIFASGAVTVQDTADVTANGGTAKGSSSYGIFANTNVSIYGGKVEATGGKAYVSSYGIYADDDVSISGGKVKATGGTAEDSSSHGIYADDGNVTISGTADVTATGGTAKDSSYGIYSNGVTVQDTASVTATGGASENGKSNGIYADNDVTIFDTADVTAQAGAAAGDSYGISANKNVTIKGTADVTANGGTGSFSCGIRANGSDVSIQDTAVVTAQAGAATGNSYGIFAFDGDVSISGTAVVTANGGESKYISCGIFSSKNVSISGGTVTAEGGAATDTTSGASYGIRANTGNVTISGGSLIAQGATSAMNKEPSTLPAKYQWRTKESDGYTKNTDDAYIWASSHKYLEVTTATGFTVTFNANGGTGTMADVTGISGEYTLPSNGFTAPTGKQFKCWSVDGNEKKVGDTITITADTTVTAVWKTKTGNKPSGNIQSPQTGDNSMMWLWGSLLFVSSLGVAATAVYGKKRTSVK